MQQQWHGPWTKSWNTISNNIGFYSSLEDLAHITLSIGFRYVIFTWKRIKYIYEVELCFGISRASHEILLLPKNALEEYHSLKPFASLQTYMQLYPND